jgi:hypothetical protein
MRNIVARLTALVFAAVPVAALAATPTEAQVRQSIKKGVVFAILPSANGSVARCRFDMTQDGPTNKPDPNFTPSAKFVAEGCRKLSENKHWEVSRGTNGDIKEVFDFCMWSTIIPDSPICRAGLGE